MVERELFAGRRSRNRPRGMVRNDTHSLSLPWVEAQLPVALCAARRPDHLLLPDHQGRARRRGSATLIRRRSKLRKIKLANHPSPSGDTDDCGHVLLPEDDALCAALLAASLSCADRALLGRSGRLNLFPV